MGCLRGMLPITALVQLTFYKSVAYFEKRRTETESRLKKKEVKCTLLMK